MDQPTPAQPLSPIARMKLHAELTILARDKLALKNSASEPMAAFKVASIASKIVRNLTLLGIDLAAPRRAARAFELEGGPEPVEAERQVTAKFFDFDPNRKHSQRKKDNAAAMELLRRIDAGDLNPISLTDGQKETLARYSGTGGNLVGADGKAGSAYEYYTPKPIAAGMWDLLSELGFKGGKVLDPCAGVGIFGATAPANAAMETVELNSTSGRINQLVNGGPGYNAIVSPFEAVASRTADEIYDAVISNVPFGGVHDRGSNRKIDEKYQDQPLETYFILRSLEKLKPGGLAAFIVPPRVVSAKGGREEQLRIAASYMAEFRGAYRLPNSVFGTADADTITDVIVFRKFGREALNKIAELKEQNPAVLVQANVQWTDFVGGRYFDTEGKRFVLGEFVAKDPNKFRDVDRVVSDQSVPNVAKLLRKFPDSRIDWKLLDATETEPISYADGDTMTLAGQTLEMRDGRWVALGRSTEDDSQDALGTVLTTATAAVTNKVSWEQARGYVSYLRERSMDMELPIWLREAHRDLQDLAPAEQPRYWAALSAGIAAVEVSQQHSEEAGFNYLEEYPVVSEALSAGAATARKAPASFSRNGKAALKKIGIVYDRRSGFSAIWRGEVQTDVMAGRVLDEDAQVEAIKYQTQGITLDVSALKGIYGDQFDPLADDDWCVSADGTKATKADDYYVGNYAEFLARIDGEIAQASGPLRDKLLRQKDMAAERVGRVDPSGLRFNLFSPFVDIEEKAEFLRRFMHPAFAVAFDDEGNKVIICDISSPKTEQERQFKRFAEYLKKGNLSTRSSKDENAELDEQRRKMLRGMVAQSSAQFDQWVKANPVIMERLRVTANDPARLYFNEVEDTSPLKIDGMAPSLALHGYQNAFVRSQGRSFGGINGFAVGLGKAQPLDAKIMTPDGWKRMGDIAVGDMVIAVDGTAVPVTGVYPQGEKEIFEVEFSDGAKTRCCDEHLWFTQTWNDRHGEWRHARSGSDKRFPGSVKSLAEIRKTIFKAGGRVKNHAIPLVCPVEHPTRDLPIDPYLLGVLLGDGALSGKGVRFTTNDQEIVERVECIVSDMGGGRVARYSEGSGAQFGIAFSHDGGAPNPVSSAITSLGLRGTVSHTKFVPKEYLVASVSQRTALLQGLMDTDGTVTTDGSRVVFASTSEALAHAVVSLVQSLGGVARLRDKAPSNYSLNGEKKVGKASFLVNMTLPASVSPFSLQRKNARVKQTDKYLSRHFVGVRSVGEAPAQCISIDHPSRLYVTDDYIVTHNTFAALAATQYVQRIGVKKKTLFVVPNSVLSNWRKEAGRAYTSMDDCLFVGLDINEKTGKASVDSGNYARDFTRILENRHRKIFCTLEAFKTIPLKDETVELYDSYLTGVDPSYADSEKKADSERSASKRAEATSGTGAKSSAIPFFEDMGIDSLVIDEAHMFKNSKQTVEFSGAKFLSVADASQRGLDIQIKAWFVRGLSPLHDGVLGLTATPITNSPLEIYSMLCLAVGEQKVHDLCMGARGADAFMDAMCVIVDDEEATIDGRVKPYRVFSGLQNVELLRTALSTVANIKNAEDVKDGGDDLKLPEAPENKTPVQLPQPVRQVLNEYKMAYRAARYEEGVAAKDAEPPTEEEYAALARVADKFGEPVSLIAHPFNLINKMTMLIADPELDERASFYSFAPVQADKARAAILAFNKLGKIEARALAGPHTDADAVVGQKIVKDGDTEVVLIKIKVQAKIGADGRIVLDTMDTKLQEEFEKQAEKAGLDLDVSVPPKLAALLENVRNEEANPRSASGRVKQLIFCDVLPLHNKIKRLLTRRAGFAASAIAIISGQAIKNPEQMQGIQDGFNAEGEDNKFRVVIANEKAEVGINLQKGTQAIHHLTIGWTPDSTIQRNGRGVRQGNTTARVNIYHYDAEGTFDEYKRTLTSKKADWIGAVMDRNGGNEVAVSGGLTNDQYDELIESMGDATAIQAIKARAELREKQARAESARARQVINIQTAQSQQKFVLKFSDPKHWIRDKALALYDLRLNLAGMRQRAGGNMNANALIRLETRIAEAQARVDGMVRDLSESAEFVRIEGYGPSSREVKLTIDEALTPRVYGRSPTAAKQREAVHNYLISGIRVKPDSVLVQDWQSEIDAAKRMVDEAVKDFERIAADSEGGYSADFIQAFKDDEIQVIDGKLFAKGMFVRDRKGTLGVLQSKTVVVRFPAGRIAVADLLRAGAQFITPGTSEHDQALSEAAALDDAAEGVTETNKDMLFSAIVPEVAQRRKSATLIDFDAGYVTLPSPFFRYPVNPDAVGASDALVVLARSQEGIIKSWTEGGKRIRVDATADVQKVYPQPSSKLRALRDHAKAHGVRYTVRDFGILAGYGAGDGASLILGSLKELGDWPDNWFERFTAAQDVDVLGAVLRELVTAAFGAWLDIPQGLDTMSLMATQMVGAYNRRVAELRAAAAAALAAQNQSVEPEPEQIVVAGVTPNARGLIGIQGETRPNKEHIKAAAKAVGGYARWNGDAGRWDVPAQTWDYLVKNQPNVAKALYPVPA